MNTHSPPIVVLVQRADLLRALNRSSESLRRYIASGKVPRPDIDMGNGQQWWHPQTLARAGINLQPADQAAASQPTPAAS